MHMYRDNDNEQGFTLPELLVVTAVTLVLVFVSVALLKPVTYAQERQDARRWLGLAAMAQTLQRYKAATGQFPSHIPRQTTGIGSGQSHYSLCNVFVPEYMKDLPIDPETGSKFAADGQTETAQPCRAKGVQYITGYSIRQDDRGEITLSAPSAKRERIEIRLR